MLGKAPFLSRVSRHAASFPEEASPRLQSATGSAATMEYRDIIVDSQGQIGSITLNSPKTFNALSKNLIGEMISALGILGADPALKVIIIKTSGKHFCSGHNLTEMVNGTDHEYRFIFDQCTRMMTMVHQVPQIVIAQVHGVATAAGCQLVATCDLAVADETARFGTPGVKIGLFCTTPMVALDSGRGAQARAWRC